MDRSAVLVGTAVHRSKCTFRRTVLFQSLMLSLSTIALRTVTVCMPLKTVHPPVCPRAAGEKLHSTAHHSGFHGGVRVSICHAVFGRGFACNGPAAVPFCLKRILCGCTDGQFDVLRILISRIESNSLQPAKCNPVYERPSLNLGAFPFAFRDGHASIGISVEFIGTVFHRNYLRSPPAGQPARGLES